MRKFTKIISIIAILVTLVGIMSGCMRGDVMTTLYFGVPFAEDSEHWAALSTAVEDNNLYWESDYVRFELVSIPEDDEGKISFLKKVDRGEIALMIYDRDEHLDKYLKNGRLATLTEIQQVYPSCYETAKQFMLDTSTDSDGMNHMLAIAGSYQGVFFNEKIFIDNGLEIPKTWEQFTTTIQTLQAKGITAIAGGFADGGMKYWMDELILMEGGVAEHSYVPKYGVVNSWARAMNDFKALYESKAFNDNCMEATQAEAIEMFTSGKAAMILCNSKDVAPTADAETTGVFALPVTTTGKKNIGDIICDYTRGVYINSQFLKKKEEVIDAMVEMVTEYLNDEADDVTEDPDAEWEDYIAEPIEWSYPAYSESWTLPANPYTIGIEKIIEDNEFTSPEDLEPVDPTIPEKIKERDNLQNRVFMMMEHVTEAGRSLTTEFKTFDYFIDLVKNYTLNGGDAEAILTDATNKEVAAQNGTDAQAETKE